MMTVGTGFLLETLKNIFVKKVNDVTNSDRNDPQERDPAKFTGNSIVKFFE